MTKMKVQVTERYPDGTKWVHLFPTREAAERAMRASKEWHPARTYVLEELV